MFAKVATLFSKYNYYFVKSLAFHSKGSSELSINFDYVRFRAFELCIDEILRCEVKGSVAELGVYKGDSASKLNQLLPNKTLYLFDTFEGFDKRDLTVESEKFATKEDDFSDTSIDFVKRKMKYPDMCVFVKGYFPESVVDIVDTFAFVSLDADLYEPTKNGLEYFYDRLEKNGYIFIHDFNNELYKGVQTAVLEFCENRNIGYVPIPDICGSVIITK